MKFTDLDTQLRVQFLIQTRALSIACQILADIFNKLDPTCGSVTPEQIGSDIADRACMIVESLSDEEIEKELQECDRILELSKRNGKGGVLSLDTTNNTKEVIWSKRHGFN